MLLGCEERDAELLMYSHGELPALQNLRVWLHLRNCSSCRRRAQEFALVSTTMKGFLQPVGAAWVAPKPKSTRPQLIAIGAVAALAAVGIAQYFAANEPVKRPAPPSFPSIESKQACTDCHTPHEAKMLQNGANRNAALHAKIKHIEQP